MSNAPSDLDKLIAFESLQFKKFYKWLEEHMPSSFFEEFEQSHMMTIAHNLMGFNLQGNFIQTHFANCSIVLCLDSPDADLKILKNFSYFGIKNYQTFISDEPPPIKGVSSKLRIAMVYFTQLSDREEFAADVVDEKTKNDIFSSIHYRNPEITRGEFDKLFDLINARFFRFVHEKRMVLALDMLFRARSRDHIQYEVKMNRDWNQGAKKKPSMQIVFAWKNTQKYHFIYRLAKLVYRHNLVMQRVNAAYLRPYSESSNILLMSLALHGQNDQAAWEATDIKDFLQELATLKYFPDGDLIESTFVSAGLLSGNFSNFIRSLLTMTHQFLLHKNASVYDYDAIEQGFCKNPKLITEVCTAFAIRFDPEFSDRKKFTALEKDFFARVEKIDTGNLSIDNRHRDILKTAMLITKYTLKTNFYRKNKGALGFRLDPELLNHLPYKREEKFPELPFGIFFFQGRCFIGFHIRFKDLSRGGLRTVFPWKAEQAVWERENVFSECYNLAYTQQKKNKDIPEGGSKGVIFLEPYQEMHLESYIYEKELLMANTPDDEVKEKVKEYQNSLRNIYLYQAQRSYVYTLITLVNCRKDGKLKSIDIVDYYQKPEYIYLGPDENMHNSMIEWIAHHSVLTKYKPGKAFISSKPDVGINHKEYGVTSLGVNVYMHEVLKYLGIDPLKDHFTVKISGGPDGDVAGNQICNLHKYYKDTAKLLAITDVSGTMYDPDGLDLDELLRLFKEAKPINQYNPNKLHEGGFLLDLNTRREDKPYSQQTLCYKKEEGKLVKHWLVGNDTHHLFSHNLHQVAADIFIPAGGRPRTLNASNWQDFLDPTGEPTAKGIIEGANLYLTNDARKSLEKKGVILIKDSSANKGGVICSSLEVLIGLIMKDEDFLKHKRKIMQEVLDFIKDKAKKEATLLLQTRDATGKDLSDISDWISKKINTFTYAILDFLEDKEISKDPKDPLTQCLLRYCPKLFCQYYQDAILNKIPEVQQKAMIACYIASKVVYTKGLDWNPSITDILPLIVREV